MPIYDYHCDHCGHAFSAVKSFTDAPVDSCPSCGKHPRKLMATPAIVFKGGGWYKTDSRPTPKDASATASKDGLDTADRSGTGAKDDASVATATADAKTGPKTETTSDTRRETARERKSDTKTETKSDSKPKTEHGTKSERPAAPGPKGGPASS